MRDLHELDRYRITDPAKLRHVDGWPGDGTHGAFIIPSPGDHKKMVIIAAADAGWDHVSVSRENRPPYWLEMSFIHRLFFLPEEVAMQLHVPMTKHVNIHPNVLHLWRPHNYVIPLPPKVFV